MTKYKGTAYPNWESYDIEVEAESKEEAKEEIDRIANQNCSFGVDIEDIKEVEEDNDLTGELQEEFKN